MKRFKPPPRKQPGFNRATHMAFQKRDAQRKYRDRKIEFFLAMGLPKDIAMSQALWEAHHYGGESNLILGPSPLEIYYSSFKAREDARAIAQAAWKIGIEVMTTVKPI